MSGKYKYISIYPISNQRRYLQISFKLNIPPVLFKTIDREFKNEAQEECLRFEELDIENKTYMTLKTFTSYKLD